MTFLWYMATAIMSKASALRMLHVSQFHTFHFLISAQNHLPGILPLRWFSLWMRFVFFGSFSVFYCLFETDCPWQPSWLYGRIISSFLQAIMPWQYPFSFSSSWHISAISKGDIFPGKLFRFFWLGNFFLWCFWECSMPFYLRTIFIWHGKKKRYSLPFLESCTS